jgi:hypothetical protein
VDYALKALDSVAGANYERKDLSPIITMQDGPQRPVLQNLGTTRAKGKTHYWDELGLNKPGHGVGSYTEGAKPAAQVKSPVQLSNVICRIGFVAQVTDTMAAIWTGAGAYTLKDGELERLYSEAMDLEVALRSIDCMNEAEWMLIWGDSTNTEAWAGGQCDGILKSITTNVQAAGTSSSAFDVSKANATNWETQWQTLASNIRKLYTPTVPNLALVTAPQKAGVNAFIGGGAGRPLVQIISPDSAGYVAGSEVDEYQTGFFKMRVQITPQLEIGAASGKTVPPTEGTTVFLDTHHYSRADLIPFSREPLARISTTLEAMVTWEFTLEYRNQKSSGKIIYLNG